ncbi:alpha-ketoglutarate-dependent dioxygenase AlkB [Acidocella aquatica]|uniref:Alpha-ketoglutarate-dependent dioxygenase AlkB n=1 Tax=Acidocella aquatica TaxID=1922313 RepID=A0ABQ6AEB6_9PROT|nr:DNA oxidative demethylase AlkB [Acidocella aquatica]GLR68459.1 alpha-ketoglutarate-dependent dioxygenase AlkB [Acidocella aquatica]
MTAELFPVSTPGLTQLPGFARGEEEALLAAVEAVIAMAPWRQVVTPGGKPMSVHMSNCGAAGWVSDRRGYRYSAVDPLSERSWPAMPGCFARLAARAAAAAGFAGFAPDACLINLYEPGARMALHQDRDEVDFSAPIVSLSLGLPAVFLWGGAARADKAARIELHSGDVVAWGGAARLNFHGVLPLREGVHPLLGRRRINLTFRKAL